jgi:hypothetical protein
MSKPQAMKPLPPPAGVTEWPEMEQLALHCERMGKLLARLKGITDAAAPLVSTDQIQHFRATVAGYRQAIFGQAADIVTAIAFVASSHPEVSHNGKAKITNRS